LFHGNSRAIHRAVIAALLTLGPLIAGWPPPSAFVAFFYGLFKERLGFLGGVAPGFEEARFPILRAIPDLSPAFITVGKNSRDDFVAANAYPIAVVVLDPSI
jgi:hypothetical protein